MKKRIAAILALASLPGCAGGGHRGGSTDGFSLADLLDPLSPHVQNLINGEKDPDDPQTSYRHSR